VRSLIRSILHMAWLLITVIPWGLTLVVISLWVRRTPLWWFAVNWFRLVIWGTRVILGIQVRVSGLENLPQGSSSPAILLSIAGIGAGLGLSLVAVRFLRAMLWGVRQTDPLTFTATSAILLLVAVLATLAPALRILRMDPSETLRSE